jgi:putative membrane protein
MRIIAGWILFSIAIYITAWLLEAGIQVDGFTTALILAIGLGLINAIIRPIVMILTLPLNILTLGLLTFVINALMVLLAARLVSGFVVVNFWWALLFSLVVSVINGILQTLIGHKKHA